MRLHHLADVVEAHHEHEKEDGGGNQTPLLVRRERQGHTERSLPMR